MKRNPRDIPWTVLYRRKHKKGLHADDNTAKKRVKRTVQVPFVVLILLEVVI